ncbi:MAG: hypothetical protein H6700_04055 [Myxococcales bacterium]|nr:hypothetical protein [Myxococcales bacterium]MCB9530917.1 hypothetical protein [Myxococcales bacterium]
MRPIPDLCARLVAAARPSTALVLLTLVACGGPQDPFAEDVSASGADAATDATTSDIDVREVSESDAAPPDAVDDTDDSLGFEPSGPACDVDSDCSTGVCAPTASGGVCVAPCTEDADCVDGWTCDPVPSLGTLCLCAGDPLSAESPNGVDDDCDGLVDEGLATLAFWNVRDLSTRSRDDAERDQIADVIAPYTLVALAEVGDDAIVGDLADRLSRRGVAWAAVTSSAVGNSPAATERYALLYRTDDVELLDAVVLDEVTLDTGNRFDREPFAVTIAAGTFDAELIIAHVVWGDDEDARVAEVRALGDYYRDRAESEPDTLILGDLNRNVGDADSLGWLQSTYGLLDTTSASPATKVDSASTYDHILLDPSATREYSGDHGVDLFDERMYPGDPDGASLALSDHRPVWIVLRTDLPDDD